jgi:hypothetical protein
VTVSLILLAITLSLVRGTVEAVKLSTWHFALLGAGFLRLETQLVRRLALYFGTTWLVNCVAITAILIVLVIANYYVDRRRPERLEPYLGRLSCSCLETIPVELTSSSGSNDWDSAQRCLRDPGILRGNYLHRIFPTAHGKGVGFWANIVGAVAGGLAQNASFIVGMKALLIIAAAFYALAGLFVVLGRRDAVRDLQVQAKAGARV